MEQAKLTRKATDLEDLRLLQIPQVADILSCSEEFVRQMVARREIESVLLSSRSRRIPVTAVKELIAKNLMPTYGDDPYGRLAARLKRSIASRARIKAKPAAPPAP